MKLAACIVETRKTEGLEQIIKDHMAMLPANTDLFIYHGTSTKYLRDIFTGAKFSYISDLNIYNYNRMLTHGSFWNDFRDYNRVLIFQSDSTLLKKGIEDYYPFDYIGSPWKFQNHGGNGGLSLRNPEVMKRICNEFPWDESKGNEDVYFCNVMHDHNVGNLAPRDACEEFSCESIFRLKTLGYHAIDKWLTQKECEQIKTQYDGK